MHVPLPPLSGAGPLSHIDDRGLTPPGYTMPPLPGLSAARRAPSAQPTATLRSPLLHFYWSAAFRPV